MVASDGGSLRTAKRKRSGSQPIERSGCEWSSCEPFPDDPRTPAQRAHPDRRAPCGPRAYSGAPGQTRKQPETIAIGRYGLRAGFRWRIRRSRKNGSARLAKWLCGVFFIGSLPMRSGRRAPRRCPSVPEWQIRTSRCRKTSCARRKSRWHRPHDRHGSPAGRAATPGR